MNFEQIHNFFWVAIPGLCALWALRLWTLGIATRYPLLLAYLLGEIFVDVVGYLILSFAGIQSELYFWFWPVSRIVISTLLFLVLVQVYQRLVEPYDGFRKLGQMVTYGSLGLAGAVVLGSIFLDPSANLQTIPGFWVVEERSAYLALTVVALVLLAFALFFNLMPARNVLVLFAVFGVLFASQAGMWALRNFFGWHFRDLRLVMTTAMHSLCLFGGAIAFSRYGEREGREVHLNRLANRNERKVAHRLEAINQTLLDVFRL